MPDTSRSRAIEVSVVIACYNAASWLGDQLEALAQQVGAPDFEVVIVDDGSSDRSVAVAARFHDAAFELRIHPQPRVGNVAMVRNLGVERSRGRYVLFCDADDLVAPEWVAWMSEALRTQDLVAGRFAFDQLNPDWAVRASRPRQTDGLQQDGFLPFAGGGNLGVAKRTFEELGGFDPTLPALEDTDFCFRAQLAGHALEFVPDAVVQVRLRHSFRGLYRQGHGWGTGTAALHRRYLAYGMPLPSRLRHLAGWLLVLPRLLLAFDRSKLGRWFFALGWRVGRIRGNVRYRLLLF